MAAIITTTEVWCVTPCSVIVIVLEETVDWSFRSTVKNEAADSSETSVPIYHIALQNSVNIIMLLHFVSQRTGTREFSFLY